MNGRAPGAADGGICKVDRLSQERRSALMSRIRGRDTQPELVVRRTVHQMGYRFRLHRRDLPGTPDLVFPSRRIALFVHGCFWHSHRGCPKGRAPKSNLGYWRPKLQQNKKRDRRKAERLRRLGWRVVILWQCELKDQDNLRTLLRDILES